MDRRTFVKSVAATATVAGVGVSQVQNAGAINLLGTELPLPTPVLPPDLVPIPLAWAPTSTSPAASFLVNPDPAHQHTIRGFHTLMYVRDKIPAAIDTWYLWSWTHDTSRCYVYSAPTPTGPYTERGSGGVPVAPPNGYWPTHFSSGDVVWDRAGQQFITSPHGIRNGIDPGKGDVSQDSFLWSSTDGFNWRWLGDDNRPRLRCGAAFTPDAIHTGYGRLLRDIDGNLATHQGRYWWIYRGQRLDKKLSENPDNAAYDAIGTAYTPMLASASSIHADFSTKQVAYSSALLDQGLLSFGSFIRAGNAHHVYMTQAMPDPPIAPGKSLYYRTLLDDMRFINVEIPPIQPVSPGGSIAEENNIVRDPTTGIIYNCHSQGTVNIESLTIDPAKPKANAEVWIYTGI